MIVFRNADPRYPFLWETKNQPGARYHRHDEGPAQYFADTADGAWAEFIRHAEITDVDELEDVRRALWCIEIDDDAPPISSLPLTTATGDKSTYAACQDYASSLRKRGQKRIHERSAALIPGGARGHRVNTGLQNGPPREGIVVVIFDYLPNNTGWRACVGSPPAHVLGITKHF
ncbi:MAG TPA: RES domain-containing protein [Drouetiella sp.]|jgi:hypothetical protein